MTQTLVHRFQDYGSWRRQVADRVQDYRRWLQSHDLADATIERRLVQVVERLSEDRLTIAFVAEFSRGKSELINAIFFADYGRRLLPTSSGRTTMCPTELKWNPEQPPSLQLLPIETRGTQASVTEFKKLADEWMTFPLDVASGDSLVRTLQRIRDTKRIPLAEARTYGLFANEVPEDATGTGDDTMVEVPRWRHAVINFPHPLLAHGLVILDTPGLNAIGTEPELTLDLLPNAHAILFVLGVDTGVSKSDAQAWRDYIQPADGREFTRFAVLNKIDNLWDGLRTDDEIEAEVLQQVFYCSEILGIDGSAIFPVSAQRGLLAKIKGDDELLQKSRLPLLEQALSNNLVPRRREIMRRNTQGDLAELFDRSRAVLETRRRHVEEQRDELLALRGKNSSMVAQMVSRARAEKARFERGLASFQALRSVYSQQANLVFAQLGVDALNEEARVAMLEARASRFTTGVRSSMTGYFDRCRARLNAAERQIAEIHRMMEAIYRRYEAEQGLKLGAPPAFSLERYHKEFQRIEGLYQRHFDTVLTMLTTEAGTLLRRFIETIATQVRRVFSYANREADQWFRASIQPLETQIRERQQQLRRRLESIKRIHAAADTLDERVRELSASIQKFQAQVAEVDRIEVDLYRVLETADAAFPVAA